MKPEDNLFEHIEDYLNHRLSPAEQQAFEKTLQEQPELSQKVKAHELANDMLLENRLLSVNKTLVDYHHSKVGWSTSSKIGLAVGLLALGSGAFFYFSNVPAPQSIVVKQEVEKPLHKVTEVTKEPIHKTEISKPSPLKKEGKVATEAKVSDQPKNNQSLAPNEVLQPQVAPQQEAIVVPKHEHKSVAVEPKVNPSVPETPTDPCGKVKITATIAQKAACKDEENGSLWLSESKGGTAPYKIQVLDHNKQVVDAHQLMAGSYEVLVKDAQGCVSIQKVTVSQKVCEKNYLFNAFAGELLEIPAYSADGVLKIYDKQGNVYANIAVDAHAKAVWDGQSKNGELNEGFFNFVLEYTDHVTARGTITIVR